MKPSDVKPTESTHTVCDVCGDSTCVDGRVPQVGRLCANWGSGSIHDGQRYEIHLCECCFFRTLSGLRRERMVNSLFDEDDPDLSRFEPITHDDSTSSGR